MNIYLDLHLHSPYSQATSSSISLSSLAYHAQLLGINVIGTGDCLQPTWRRNIKAELKYDEATEMLYYPFYPETRFILTTEVNCVWGKKQAHFLLVLPTSNQILVTVSNSVLRYGQLWKEGRPSLAIHPKKLQEDLKNISKAILFIPAHCLTPWYGLLGSRCNLLSIWEVFSPQAPPDALETGLSASSEMCWKIEEIRGIPLVSFSDAHSIQNLGREVTVIDNDLEFNYSNIIKSIKENQISTLEYPPQLGKYYWDGHRKCDVAVEPNSFWVNDNFKLICPVCNRRLTKGVLHRMLELSKSNQEGYPDTYIIPDKDKCIEDRVVDISRMRFECGYDGRYGKVL